MSSPEQDEQRALALPNIRRFLLFRLLFNGRFYYPVFTILFLDYGLTLDQFATLNAIWAATIVLSEVPSGAMADRIGRKRLVVMASVAMVLEIALIAFVPLGNAALVYAVFAANRVLSGLAEAAASGADEALAFDTLQREGLSHTWARVLESAMRLQSVAFVFAMGLGAFSYDAAVVNRALALLGADVTLAPTTTMRFPVYLTLAAAALATLVALGLREERSARDEVANPWRETFAAGRWMLGSGPVLVLLAAGVLFDGVNRQFVTLASEYYRTIQFPEWSFGLLGAGVAVIGFFLPRVARAMTEALSPERIALGLAVWSALGLFGVALVIPYAGIAFAVMSFSTLSLTGFFLSHYLNQVADSDRRATILSFRGLSLNLAYGVVSLAYGALAASVEARGEGEVFTATLQWFGPTFVALFALLVVGARWRLGHLSPRFEAPSVEDA